MDNLKDGAVVRCKHGEILTCEALDKGIYPSQYKFKLVDSKGLPTYYVDSKGGYTPPAERVQVVSAILTQIGLKILTQNERESNG